MPRAGSRRCWSERDYGHSKDLALHWEGKSTAECRAWSRGLIGSHPGSNKIPLATMLHNVGTALGLLLSGWGSAGTLFMVYQFQRGLTSISLRKSGKAAQKW